MGEVRPHEGPQMNALQSTEFEIMYGGARGGGKTFCGILRLLYDTENPNYRALVIRRNYADLTDWIDRAKTIYNNVGAEYVSGEFKFPSGAVIRLGHLGDDNAYSKYQGHEYHRMVIEELTQIPNEELYLKLVSSCRSTNPDLKPQVFSTSNPGGIGHSRVKKRFVDVSLPGVPYIDPVTKRGRIFIPAKVEDNPTLLKNDPDYVKFLDGLPDELRKAWREGSWDVYESRGSYYSPYIMETRSQKRICNVPYEPMLPTYKFRDLGIDDNMVITVCQFFGREVRVIDCIYGTDYGIDHYIPIIRDKYGLENMRFPHDIAVREQTTGMTRKEIIEKTGIKVNVTPNIEREDGIQAVRTIFNNIWFDEIKCQKLIEALNVYRKRRDEKNLVYKEPIHDWSSDFADSFRYMAVCYTNIINANIRAGLPKKQNNLVIDPVMYNNPNKNISRGGFNFNQQNNGKNHLI